MNKLAREFNERLLRSNLKKLKETPFHPDNDIRRRIVASLYKLLGKRRRF